MLDSCGINLPLIPNGGSKGQVQKIFSAFSPAMEAMEGAVVAHVAAIYQTPLIEIRVASNQVGSGIRKDRVSPWLRRGCAEFIR